jgi:hypothetical protein
MKKLTIQAMILLAKKKRRPMSFDTLRQFHISAAMAMLGWPPMVGGSREHPKGELVS